MCRRTDGRTDILPRRRGVYRYIYTPKISYCFVHVWDINTYFEIAMTIAKTYTSPNQIPGYATGHGIVRAMHTRRAVKMYA